MRTKVLLMTVLLLAGLVGSAAYEAKAAVREISVPAGTRIPVRLNQTLDTARNRAGDSFTAILTAPVMVNGAVAVPKGTPFRGHVTAAKPSGRLRGRGYMGVTLDSFEMNGRTYQLDTAGQGRSTNSHKKRNWLLIGGGGGFGALVGGLAGGWKGLAIGGPAGAAAGVAGAAITGKKQVRLPAETALTFRLEKPVLVRA